MYKGILRATGETVAVKVQRPGIGDHIAIDMLLLRRLMAVIDKNQTVVRPYKEAQNRLLWGDKTCLACTQPVMS